MFLGKLSKPKEEINSQERDSMGFKFLCMSFSHCYKIIFSLGAIYKGRPADPWGGGYAKSGRSIVILSVILLFYSDAGKEGV